MGNLFQSFKLPFTIIPGSIGPVPYDLLLLAGAALVVILLAVLLIRKCTKKAPAQAPTDAPAEAPVAAAPAEDKPAEDKPVEEAPAPKKPVVKKPIIPEKNDTLAAIAKILGSLAGEGDDDMATVLVTEEGKRVQIKYRKSFRARVLQADDETKTYYSDIKAYLLSFDGIAASDSQNYEGFAVGRKQIAKMNISGKTVLLFLALDPATLEGSKYKYDNVGDRKRFEKTPVKVKIRSARSFKWAKELIEMTMAANERPFVAALTESFVDGEKTKEELIAHELIQIAATDPDSGAKITNEELLAILESGVRIDDSAAPAPEVAAEDAE